MGAPHEAAAAEPRVLTVQCGYASWLAGDVHNTPGRSLYVRLRRPSSGKGAAGK